VWTCDTLEHLFTHQHCEEDIRSVVCAIKESRPSFRAFCALSGAIESLTDTMSLEGEEPAEHQKRELLPLLVEFLSMLPDKETFCFWLHEN